MDNSVTPYELAVLVLSYLDQNGYRKTAASFKREAKAHFQGATGAAPPPGVRNLLDLMNDYVRLKEQETRRLALAGRNPLALCLIQALDAESQEQQTAVDAAAAAAQAAAAREAAAAAVQQQEAVAAQRAQAQWLRVQPQQAQQPVTQQQLGAGFQHRFVPLVQGNQRPAGPAQAGGQQLTVGHSPGSYHAIATAPAVGQQQAVTPARQRKGAPRKRLRGAGSPTGDLGASHLHGLAGNEGDGGIAALQMTGGAGGGGWGSPMDLLNLPLDAEGLEALLDDGPLQLQFAENLAQHINENLGAAYGGGSRPPSGLGTAGASGGGGTAAGTASGTAAVSIEAATDTAERSFLAELLGDPDSLLADLPTNPQMAQVLQAVVRPTAASPPQPSAAAVVAALPASRNTRPVSALPVQQQEAAGAAVVAAVHPASPGVGGVPKGRQLQLQGLSCAHAATAAAEQQQHPQQGQQWDQQQPQHIEAQQHQPPPLQQQQEPRKSVGQQGVPQSMVLPIVSVTLPQQGQQQEQQQQQQLEYVDVRMQDAQQDQVVSAGPQPQPPPQHWEQEVGELKHQPEGTPEPKQPLQALPVQREPPRQQAAAHGQPAQPGAGREMGSTATVGGGVESQGAATTALLCPADQQAAGSVPLAQREGHLGAQHTAQQQAAAAARRDCQPAAQSAAAASEPGSQQAQHQQGIRNLEAAVAGVVTGAQAAPCPRSQQALLDSAMLSGASRATRPCSPAKPTSGSQPPLAGTPACGTITAAVPRAVATGTARENSAMPPKADSRPDQDPCTAVVAKACLPHEAEAASLKLISGLKGLGPLEVPASEDQLLQDIDELF